MGFVLAVVFLMYLYVMGWGGAHFRPDARLQIAGVLVVVGIVLCFLGRTKEMAGLVYVVIAMALWCGIAMMYFIAWHAGTWSPSLSCPAWLCA